MSDEITRAFRELARLGGASEKQLAALGGAVNELSRTHERVSSESKGVDSHRVSNPDLRSAGGGLLSSHVGEWVKRHAAPRTGKAADGSTGYFMRRRDDCFRAAIATLVQVPYEDVVDTRVDEQLAQGLDPEVVDLNVWAAVDQWAERRRLKLVRHLKPPWQHRRWIGVILAPGVFQAHALIMAKDQLIFDPCPIPGGMHLQYGPVLARSTPERITYGLSFNQRR